MILDPQDRDLIVRTLYGEAAGDPASQAAVAHVIRNRMKKSGASGKDVVLAPNQFEPWGSRSAELMKLDPTSAIYAGLGTVVDDAWSDKTPDPTGGATMFYAPEAQKAKGRATPAWATGNGLDIGAHRFYSGDFPTPVANTPSLKPIMAGLGQPNSLGPNPPVVASPQFSGGGAIPDFSSLFMNQDQDIIDELFIKSLIDAGVPPEQIQMFLGIQNGR